MFNNCYIQAIGDQVGGKFSTIPASVIHIPRYQGAIFTIPAGLQITSNRKFVWSLETPIPDGVLSITNTESSTPTIEFDPNIYSGADLFLRCTIKGQPNNFIRYIVFTTLTSLITIGEITSNALIEIPQYSIQAVNNQLSIPSNTAVLISNATYGLAWSAPVYSNNILNYLVEEWDSLLSIWKITSTTTNVYINNINNNVTYRVTPKYNNFTNVNSTKPTYNQTVIPDGLGLAGHDTFILNNDNALNKIITINTGILPVFYNSIEPVEISLDNFSIFNDITLNKSLPNLTSINNATFFTQVELFMYIDNLNIYIDTFLLKELITINQQPSALIFWAEQTGA